MRLGGANALKLGLKISLLAVLAASPGAARASIGLNVPVISASQAEFVSQTGDGKLGMGATVLPDFDGDGWADIAIGVPGYEANAGGVLVFLGGPDRFTSSLVESDADYRFYGPNLDDVAGWSLASGDFNGDGLSDLAVGAPGTGSDSGAVYVVFGAASFAGDPLRLRLDLHTTFTGQDTVGRFGWSLAAPDLDGDGFDDLLVGAPRSPYGGTDGGRVFLRWGAAGEKAGWTNGGSSSFPASWFTSGGGWLGYSIAVLPRYSGDTKDDVAIGAPGGDPTQGILDSTPGRVFVVIGRAQGNFSGAKPIASSNEGFYVAEGNDDAMGMSVANAGDFTGDGLDDIVFGAPRFKVGSASLAGKVYLIRGKRSGFSNVETGIAAASTASWVGTTAGDQTGRSVASAGDMTGDGNAEILLAAPFSNAGTDTQLGQVYVVLGQSSGFTKSTNLGDPTNVWGSLRGPTVESEFCFTMTFAGDVDQDGREEALLFATNGGEDDWYGAGLGYLVDFPLIQDLDNDGVSLADEDCDDLDETFYPGAPEEPYDGLDQDCDGEDLIDVDDDGVVATQVGGPDCDDTRADVYPGAPETAYDGVDQDCLGGDLVDVDEDGFTAVEVGGDDCDDTRSDVHPGVPEIAYDGIDQDCVGGDLTDVDGDGYSAVGVGGDDCDDALADIHPGAPETPYDGIDQDCTGGDLTDVDQDGAASDTVGGDDCNDADPAIHPGATEVCGGDDDCDGTVDEDFDLDGDGAVSPALCPGLGDDCDDDDATSYPGAPELCDDRDNDCDEVFDEDLSVHPLWPDEDDDGYGGEGTTPIQDCAADLPGYAATDDDCDDDDPDVNPGAEEISGNDVDDDCDPSTTDADLDGDGYDGVDFGGDDCDDDDPTVNPGQTEIPYDGVDQDCADGDLTDVDDDGYAGGESGTDCDDQNGDIHPDAEEIPYDDIDQDCSGADLTDVDGDGVDGGPDGDDCDDTDATSNPGADEICDGADNDCDGTEDEGCSDRDEDGDGFFGDVDCDDADPAVHPGAVELCDADRDLNCDGQYGDGEDCASFGGGWGCDTRGGEGTAVGLAALGLVALRLSRRRRLLGALLALVPGVAAADDAASMVELDNSLRPLDGAGLVTTQGAEALIERQFSISTRVGYLNRPLSLVGEPDGPRLLVSSQSVVDLGAAYGITRWLTVGAGVPLVATQVTGLGEELLGPVGGVAPGDLRLQLKLSPVSREGLAAALIPELRVPLSSGGRAALDVLAAVDKQVGRLSLLANGGYRAYLGDATRGSVGGYAGASAAVLLRGGLALAAVPERLDLLADVWGQAGLGADALVDASPAEAAVGMRLRSGSGGMRLSAGLGTALNGAVGAARLRGYLGLTYVSSTGLTDADSDGDGIPDVWDDCRRVKEDLDGWLDTDGCIDADNDGDGVADADDKCPDNAEDGDGWEDEDGCPEADNDADEVADGDDLCPDEPEDVDGFKDEDGCPDLDNDGDGVADLKDRCPDVVEAPGGNGDGCPDNDTDQDGVADSADQCPDRSEDRDGWKDSDGCPDADNDGDGLPDLDDFCPDVPEDANGMKDDDGCPESGPAVVRVRDEVRILDEVRFADVAPDAASQALLTEAIKLLAKAPADRRIIIEVHSDNLGDPDVAKARTQAQAEAVAAFLAERGVDPARLVPMGFGAERPLATNRTERGRERNRRVVFILAPAS